MPFTTDVRPKNQYMLSVQIYHAFHDWHLQVMPFTIDVRLKIYYNLSIQNQTQDFYFSCDRLLIINFY